MDKQTLGAFIAENRRRRHLTQQQLAQMLHVTDKAVSKWERGLSYPDVTLLGAVGHGFGSDGSRAPPVRRACRGKGASYGRKKVPCGK